MHTNKASISINKEHRLCFQEIPRSEPPPKTEVSKSEYRYSPASKKDTMMRKKNESNSKKADDSKMEVMEKKMNLDVYMQLKTELGHLIHNRNASLEGIVKHMKSLKDDPSVPESFLKMTVAQLAIRTHDQLKSIADGINQRIETLEQEIVAAESDEIEPIDISEERMRSAMRHLANDYTNIIRIMKQLKTNQDVDIVRLVNVMIPAAKQRVLQALSDSMDLSAKEAKRYEDIMKELDGAHIFHLKIGQVAIMETKDFEALIGSMEQTKDALLKRLETKN